MSFRKRSDANNVLGLNTHVMQRWSMRDGRNNQHAGIFKADESTIKQLIDARRQEQPVFTVEPLLVARIPPGLAVAGDEVGRMIYLRDSPASFDEHHPLFE